MTPCTRSGTAPKRWKRNGASPHSRSPTCSRSRATRSTTFRAYPGSAKRPPAPTPPSGARSMAGTLDDVQRLVDKARAARRFAILTLTSDDEPLRDEILGLAVSLPDESVYVPLGHRPAGGASGALFAPAEL